MATKDQLIASAQKNLEKGQIKKAIKDYQELLKLEPKVDQHKQKLADLLCRIDLKEEALTLYDSLAKGYAERGFFAKAVAVYKQIQRIDPANIEAYLRLAELNRNLGLIGNALSEYRSLLELYEKRNMVADAAGVLQKMVELEPENINLQLRVLQYLLKEKLYDKATETLLKACEVCGKSAGTGKSQKILQAILTHLPDNNEFLTDLASKLSAGGLFADAIYVFHFLLARSPQDPLILNELATLYGKIDDAENEILLLEQLLAVQPTDAIAERLVRLCLATGDYGRVQRELEEHEALLYDENHSLLIDLYQELEKHLPGDKRVRSAIARFCGGPLPTIADDEVLSPSPNDSSPGETTEEFSFGDEEFGFGDLLSVRPRINETVPLSSVELLLEEETAAAESADVSIELPDEGISFEDIDTFEQAEEPTLAEDISHDDVAPSLINIDFDFSEFDDVDVETDVKIEADESSALEVEIAVADNGDQNETSAAPDLSSSTSVLNFDLSSPEEPSAAEFSLQDETTLPHSDIDYDFLEITEAEIEAEIEADVEELDSPAIEELEIELLDDVVAEPEDDDEILELEPLEEEEDDLGAELAALEDLLDAEMEDASSEEHAVFKVAVDEFKSNAPAVDDDFFDLAAEILDDGALQATEGLANVGEIDRFRFDSVFSEFKKGVDAQIDHDDTEAHYDLGIAYKEMGLMDDAIEEFKKSMRSLKRLADSLILIGICYAEKGAFADAEAVFSTAIARPEVKEADKIGTQYELGLVYEVWGRPADALRTFEAVAHNDPAFRNVGEKIEALRLLVAAGEGDAVVATPGSASPGKDRVSFV